MKEPVIKCGFYIYWPRLVVRRDPYLFEQLFHKADLEIAWKEEGAQADPLSYWMTWGLTMKKNIPAVNDEL